MSASVRLSLKAARKLQEALWPATGDRASAYRELEVAIAKASRASATRRTLRKPKQAKQKSKREVRGEVRASVAARADGKCEACGFLAVGGQLDHFFGRARAESHGTCWLLCPPCHRKKTNSQPSAPFWFERFILHCETYGYTEAEARARKRLAFVQARGAP